MTTKPIGLRGSARAEKRRSWVKKSTSFQPITYRAGDVIHDESPYAATVTSCKAKFACSHCFASLASVECSGCTKIVYCSQRCQDLDLADHRIECEILAGCKELPEDELRLAIRVLTKYFNESKKPSVGDFFGRKLCFNDLVSHIGDLNEHELRLVSTRAREVLSLLGNRLNVDEDFVTETLMRCRINRFCLIYHNDPNFFVRGQIIYLGTSAIDHTCVDSGDYGYLFDGRRIVLRAFRDFTLYDPSMLRIHYFSPSLPFYQRREMTLRGYFFLCSCEKCVQQARAFRVDPVATALSNEARKEIDTLYKNTTPGKEWFDDGLRILNKFEKSLDDNRAIAGLGTQLQLVAIKQGLLMESLRLGMRALRRAESILSIEPIIFNLCFVMAKLGWSDEDSPKYEVFRFAQRLGLNLFAVSHGPTHAIVKTLEAL